MENTLYTDYYLRLYKFSEQLNEVSGMERYESTVFPILATGYCAVKEQTGCS